MARGMISAHGSKSMARVIFSRRRTDKEPTTSKAVTKKNKEIRIVARRAMGVGGVMPVSRVESRDPTEECHLTSSLPIPMKTCTLIVVSLSPACLFF